MLQQSIGSFGSSLIIASLRFGSSFSAVAFLSWPRSMARRMKMSNDCVPGRVINEFIRELNQRGRKSKVDRRDEHTFVGVVAFHFLLVVFLLFVCSKSLLFISSLPNFFRTILNRSDISIVRINSFNFFEKNKINQESLISYPFKTTHNLEQNFHSCCLKELSNIELIGRRIRRRTINNLHNPNSNP